MIVAIKLIRDVIAGELRVESQCYLPHPSNFLKIFIS